MGKKTKQGKSRKDKFYRLAKETGYRSRASFKLVQINRTYEFLQKSRVCVDLCAAPGGWAQVAAETMPVSSIILAVDLVPIRPIPRVKSIQGDITSDACRQAIKKELQTWKADVFLNDGAPNVGKSWASDAFSQAGITLAAMKLATEFLRKGGWFVTKVFRSRDYFALMWVFKQLFQKVHATKPQASRNESAEIFVVCQGYLAPHKLDPKFLDPRHVFKEVEETGRKSIDLLHPAKVKKKAEGYEEGDYTHRHALKATEYLSNENHATLLSQATEVVVDDPELLEHSATSSEVLQCFQDIKVLGKTDIKAIMKWRKNILKSRPDLGPSEDTEAKSDEQAGASQKTDEGDNSEAEIEKLESEMHELNAAQHADAKRKKRKVLKERSKLRQKMDLKMVHPGDYLDITDDINLFDIKTVKTKAAQKLLDSDVEDDEAPGMEGEEEGNPNEPTDAELAALSAPLGRRGKRKEATYDRTEGLFYEDDEVAPLGRGQSRRSERGRAAAVANGISEGQGDADVPKDHGLSDDDDGEDDGDSDEDLNGPGGQGSDGGVAPLVQPLYEEKVSEKSKRWFEKEAFADLLGAEGLEKELTASILPAALSKADPSTPAVPATSELAAAAALYNSDGGSDDNSDDDDDTDDEDTTKQGDTRNGTGGPTGKTGASGKKRVLDAEQLALGADMIRSKKAKRDIIDDGFNRYAFNDEDLPNWFAEDETKHHRRQIPLSKESMKDYKERQKAIDARPIRKVLEAKGRKKKKALKRLEKARKKADALSEETPEGMTDREKWLQIKSIYKKAGALGTQKKSVTYVVTKKGAGKKVSRPAGVQGAFKVVDPRMKKDMRNANSRKGRTKKGRKEMKASKKQGQDRRKAKK